MMSRVSLMLMALAIAGCGGSQQPFARVVSCAGTVNVNTRAAAPGQSLAPDDLIEIASGGNAVLEYADGTRGKLVGEKDGCSLKLARSSASVLKLARGTLGLDVPPNRVAKTRYEVETANCTTSIEGTRLKVSASSAGTVVAVFTGTVSVKPAGAPAFALKALTQVTVPSTGSPGAPADYDPHQSTEEQFFPLTPTEFNKGNGR